VSRRSAALVALAGAFAALAGLVAAGAFTRLDQWAVDHAMPGASFHQAREGLLDGLVPLLHSRWGSGTAIAANIVTLPASFLIALAIAFAYSRLLAAALVAAVGVEVVSKELLERPALHHGAFHISTFDSSFPSGHALRTMVVAGAVAWTWPRARTAAVIWAAVSIVLLLLAGWHTPSDLAGGVVLGALALLVAARRLRRRG
jgi:membrane-associated phospholipid phosphatase